MRQMNGAPRARREKFVQARARARLDAEEREHRASRAIAQTTRPARPPMTTPARVGAAASSSARPLADRVRDAHLHAAHHAGTRSSTRGTSTSPRRRFPQRRGAEAVQAPPAWCRSATSRRLAEHRDGDGPREWLPREARTFEWFHRRLASQTLKIRALDPLKNQGVSGSRTTAWRLSGCPLLGADRHHGNGARSYGRAGWMHAGVDRHRRPM